MLLKIAKITGFALLGALGGIIVGWHGVLLYCIVLDTLRYPDGVPAGAGMSGYGWMYMLMSVPVGAAVGGIVGIIWGAIRVLEDR
jgi:hypothetical protein